MLTLPATNLLERCLTYEPSSRITAREALAHTFIDPLAADSAAAAAAARAAAQALRDAQRTFGGFHSDFYPPERMKRARLITPPSGAKINLARNDSVTPLYITCDNHHVDSDGRSCIPGSLRYGVRCDGSEINPGRVSPLLTGMEALYTAADMAED